MKGLRRNLICFFRVESGASSSIRGERELGQGIVGVNTLVCQDATLS